MTQDLEVVYPRALHVRNVCRVVVRLRVLVSFSSLGGFTSVKQTASRPLVR